ncbi:MAG: carboxypeptidase regulatory-like domain-containing protein [Blastocatellia bacterium]
MNISRITSFVTVSALACSVANAQPGCRNTPYSPSTYCYFARFPDQNYFVGRIEALDNEQSGATYGKIFLAVAKIKDIHGSSENNLKLVTEYEPGCVHDLVVGATYIFGVPAIAADGSAARRFSRLSLEGLTETQKIQSINNVLSILDGKRQPILFGKVTRPDGTGFANVKVTASTEFDLFSAKTDTSGDFKFEDLPKGKYKVAVNYPDGYMPDDNYRGVRETDERDFQSSKSEGWLCGTRINFGTSLSARISGIYSSGSNDWHPIFNLLDASNGLVDSHNLQGFSYGSFRRVNTEDGKSGFAFDHLKPGKYVLRLGAENFWNPLTTFYYPGVKSIRDATILHLGLGTKLDLNFEIPPIGVVTVRGRMQLTDGTPINAGLDFVDAEVPSVFLANSPADRERTDFVFTTAKDRPIFICAGYQGVLKNGQKLSVYSKLPITPTGNIENLIVTLDKVVPAGTRWYQHCRNRP